MSNYRQGSYETPFTGNVADNGPGNTLDDQFVNSRPQLFDDEDPPQPVLGFAELQSKWTKWDPGNALRFAGVDTRLQMGRVAAAGNKNLVAYYQSLPLPTTPGQSVELAIYGRILFAGAVPEEGEFGPLGPVYAGLILADDPAGEPTTSPAKILGLEYRRTEADDPPVSFLLSGTVTELVSYDAIATPVLSSECVPQYFRWRIKQTFVGVEDGYDTFIRAEFGFTGADWAPAYPYEFSGGDPIRACGFGVFSNSGTEGAMLIDSFQVVEQAFDDDSSMIGAVQQLGAV